MGLRGYVDRLTHRQIIGWAQDEEAPDTPISLVVSVDGRPVGRCLADRRRDDLVQAGIGHGRYGFDFPFPAGAVPALIPCRVAVRREGDGVAIPGSPQALGPVIAFDEELQKRLGRALVEPVDDAERLQLLGLLLEQAQTLRRARTEPHDRMLERLPAGATAPASSRPRALVIDATMPAADRDAGSNAVVSHMRSLQRIGYAVAFLPADLSGDGAVLEAEGIASYLSPWYVTVEEVLRRHAGDFRLVYVYRGEIAARYGQLVRDTQRSARFVYSVADLSHLRTVRRSEIEGRPDLAAYGQHLRILELTAARTADAVITHSTFEAALLRQHVPAERVHVVPWTIPMRPTAISFAARRGLAFLGNYLHPPNADAARFLVEAVVPQIGALGKDIPCLLVGSGMPENLQALAASQPGVEAVGRVANLAAIFDWVRLTAAPLAYGAGAKGKVLDSLAAGIPCVCTSIAAEGLDLPEPLVGLVADTPEGLARSIVALHEDEQLNLACSAAGLAYVAERLNEERIDALMRAVVDWPEPKGGPAPTSASRGRLAYDGIGPQRNRAEARPSQRLDVALVAVGTHGDVLPLVALGHALAARGHRVSLAAPAPFEAIVRRADLSFQPLGTVADYDAFIRQPDLWRPWRGFRTVFAYAAKVAEPACLWLGALQARAPGLVVVASPMAWGARLAQDLYGLPLATMHVMPFLIESLRDPARLPGFLDLRRLPPRMRVWVSRGIDRIAADPAGLPALNAVRAGFGQPPAKRLRHAWNSTDRLLLMFPDWYAAPQADWPGHAVQLGFPLVDRFGDTRDMPAEVAAFLDAGSAPLVFTYGSAMRTSASFFQTAVQVCRTMGRRGVLLAPQDGQVPMDLPPGVIHASYVPMSTLLPRCAALVHHGGVGTVAQALAAGIPQLVIPVAFNHFDDGQRLSERNLGAVLYRRAFEPGRATRVLHRLLTDPTVARACALAKARFEPTDEVLARACDAVEDLSARGLHEPHVRGANPKYEPASA